VVDEPDAPVRVDEQVALVAVDVGDELVEHPHGGNLVLPAGRIRVIRVLGLPRLFVHDDVIDPPGERRGGALVFAFHRDGHRVEAQQLRDVVRRDVELPRVAEAELTDLA
jgi:hypothetical protein